MNSVPVLSHPFFLKHECDVSTRRHDIMGGFDNASLRGFCFQFAVSQRTMLYYFSRDTYEWVHHYDVVEGEQPACWRFVVKVEDMTQCEHRAVHVITAMLGNLGIYEPEMVWKIYSTVRSLGPQVEEDIPDGRIPVLVEIVRVFQQAVPNPFVVSGEWRLHAHEDEVVVPVDQEPVPAARAAVAALEKVTLKPKETCSICLGGLVKATRMPCNHDFHERCIVRWLKTTNACPLCRFQLPTVIQPRPPGHYYYY